MAGAREAVTLSVIGLCRRGPEYCECGGWKAVTAAGGRLSPTAQPNQPPPAPLQELRGRGRARAAGDNRLGLTTRRRTFECLLAAPLLRSLPESTPVPGLESSAGRPKCLAARSVLGKETPPHPFECRMPCLGCLGSGPLRPSWDPAAAPRGLMQAYRRCKPVPQDSRLKIPVFWVCFFYIRQTVGSFSSLVPSLPLTLPSCGEKTKNTELSCGI